MSKLLIISVYRVVVVLILLCTFIITLLSQENNLGIPKVYNYTKEDYKGGTQNWEGLYLNKGEIWFANNNGLLSFDGKEWNVLETPKGTICRSVALSDDYSRIWVGGQDEIGYFILENGKYVFKDQKHLIPEEHQSLEDVWDISTLSDGSVFFRSRNKIFILENDTCTLYNPKTYVSFLRAINDKIYFNDAALGLLERKDGKEVLVKGGEFLKDMAIIDMIAIDDSTSILLTSSNGLFILKNDEISKFRTNSDSFFGKYNLLSGHYIQNHKKLAIGSEAGGLVVLDLEGRTQFIMNKGNGLQNSTISSMTSDGTGNLWLGTYNGIDKVDFSSLSSYLYPDGELEGAVFDIEEWKGYYFFATSNGVFKIEIKEYYDPVGQKSFEKVENSDGQAWNLSIVDDVLFIGHTNGAMQISTDGNKAKAISETIGAWKFVEFDDETMIVGTYFGLDLYKMKNKQWTLIKKLEGFYESSRILFKDINGDMWVSHPYKGLFRMRFSDDYMMMEVDTIDQDFGLENVRNCYVHEIDNVPFVSSDSGVYVYDYKTEQFAVSEQMNVFFEGQKFKRFFDTDRGLWYITDREAGVLEKSMSGLNVNLEKKTYLQGELSFVGGFEYLFPLSDQEAFLATDKGVKHGVFNEGTKSDPKVRILSVQISSSQVDSLVYQAVRPVFDDLDIDYEFHDVRIDFVSDWMETKDDNVQYSYQLEGNDEYWSDWTNLKFKEYTNLSPGDYVFHVKSSTHQNPNSTVSSFSFSVKHPWYSSFLMKMLYLILAIIGLGMLIHVPNRKIKKEKEIIEIQQKETEAIVEDLESEKLQNEIKFQNRELANLTMHLLQKSETLKQIKTEVENVRKKIKDPEAKKEIKKVVSLLNSDNRLEEDWNNFSYHFDKVHHDFLKRLKEQYSKLTANDLKLCAYLRLNLSTKEIAPLLNISTRGVEISRYRLRKKLELTSETNLNSFMMGF